MKHIKMLNSTQKLNKTFFINIILREKPENDVIEMNVE